MNLVAYLSIMTTALVAILGTTAIAEAGTIRFGTNDKDYQTLATLYPSVGLLNLNYSSNPSQLCSGTLIQTEWILTAAHCLESKVGKQNVTSGLFRINGIDYPLIGGVKKAQWVKTNRNLSLGYDIALLKITSNNLTKALPSVTPANYLNLGLFNEDKKIGTYVGFGRSGDGITGAGNPITGVLDPGAIPAGTKRAGQNRIIVYQPNPRLLASDFDDPLFASNPFYEDLFDNAKLPLPYEYNLAPGDSGGGLFMNFAGGQSLVGVNSFIRASDGYTNADYEDESYAVRVSQFEQWIWGITMNYSNKFSIPSTVIPGVGGSSIPVLAVADNFDWIPNNPDLPLFEFTLTEDTFAEDISIPTPTPTPTTTPISTNIPEPSTIGALLLTSLLAMRYSKQCKQG